MTDPRSGRCPDGGYCHGSSLAAGSPPCREGACLRVRTSGPLSGVYPGDRWPDEVYRANGLQPIHPRPTPEHLRLALVTLWPGRDRVEFAGPDALDAEEVALLQRTALAIVDAEDRGRAERGAVVDAIGEALMPELVRAFSGLDLMPGSTLRLTERAAERFARFAVDTLLAVVPGGSRDG